MLNDIVWWAIAKGAVVIGYFIFVYAIVDV